MLALLLREPFCGPMTPAIYADTPDRVITLVYFAPRDEKGRLIPQRGRGDDHAREREERINNAASELPSPESLGIPQEVLHSQTYFVAPYWAVCFWQVWRGRGESIDQVLKRWRREGHGA